LCFVKNYLLWFDQQKKKERRKRLSLSFRILFITTFKTALLFDSNNVCWCNHQKCILNHFRVPIISLNLENQTVFWTTFSNHLKAKFFFAFQTIKWILRLSWVHFWSVLRSLWLPDFLTNVDWPSEETRERADSTWLTNA